VSSTAQASFFRSRWVERPAHVAELEATALPSGFRAAGVAAGIKSSGLDVGLLASDERATASAARFTTSAVLGAPVIVSRGAALERLRAVVASSGNANVADGERGIATATAAQAAAADVLDVPADAVGVAATGVIGRELPRQALVAGIERAGGELGPDAGDFSEALLTTDRGPKHACLEVSLPSGTVRLAGQAKGAGMVAPAFATVLCFVETDAELDPQTLDLLTGVTVKRSFDRTTVDGQLSTSDSLFVLASGASGVRVEQETDDELALGEALDALLRQLALEVVGDGEGALRIGRIVVRGAAEAVEPAARAIANSPLVKTALHGADPNFGRILAAAGQALAGWEPLHLDLRIEGRQLVSAGAVLDLTSAELEQLAEAVGGREVEYELTLPGEGGETEVFFSDLSHEYVTLNAEYTT